MKRKFTLYLILFSLVTILFQHVSCISKNTHSIKSHHFIGAENTSFSLNNQDYFIKGCNYWYGGYLAKRQDTAGYQRLTRELNFLQKQGINNLRVMFASEGDSSYAFRIYPSFKSTENHLDTNLFYGFDVLLHELHKRQMTATMILGNNWEWSGGFGQYLDWHESAHGKPILPKTPRWNWDSFCTYLPQFYTCQHCKTNYFNTIKLLINRINCIDHLPYTKHPAILSWEIANEPRPMQLKTWQPYKNWIQATADTIHKLDANHLITIGQEGSISLFNDIEKFKEIHQLRHIDYATIHIWPKTWQWYLGKSEHAISDSILKKSAQYIAKHALACKQINKPLVLEEFGLHRDQDQFHPESSVNNRNQYYQYIFQQINQFKLAGFNFWGAIALKNNADCFGFMKESGAYAADPPQEEQGLYGVYESDTSTWQIIRAFRSK